MTMKNDYNKISNKRLSVFYNINNQTLIDTVEKSREAIAYNSGSFRNGVKLIGRAGQYPLHVTIKGIFRLGDHTNLNGLVNSITHNLADLNSFRVTTIGLLNFPDDTISLGFSKIGIKYFRELQTRILKVIDTYIDKKIIEPEYRHSKKHSNKNFYANTLKYGEPYIGEEYNPHITIASGIENKEDFNMVRNLIAPLLPSSYDLVVDNISLIFEENIAGIWKSFFEHKLN